MISIGSTTGNPDAACSDNDPADPLQLVPFPTLLELLVHTHELGVFVRLYGVPWCRVSLRPDDARSRSEPRNVPSSTNNDH